MNVVVAVLIVLVSVFLILVVLVQNSKGGGLVSNFSSSNQVMGVRKTTDFLEKSTWILAISLLMLCLVSTVTNKPIVEGVKEIRVKDQVSNSAAPEAAPFIAPGEVKSAPAPKEVPQTKEEVPAAE